MGPAPEHGRFRGRSEAGSSAPLQASAPLTGLASLATRLPSVPLCPLQRHLSSRPSAALACAPPAFTAGRCPRLLLLQQAPHLLCGILGERRPGARSWKGPEEHRLPPRGAADDHSRVTARLPRAPVAFFSAWLCRAGPVMAHFYRWRN